MDPIQMIKTLMSQNANPQQIAMQMLQSNSTPIMNNLIGLAQKGDSKQVETIARNMCKERGIDYDREFTSFMTNFR